jgi:hypothetical protein
MNDQTIPDVAPDVIWRVVDDGAVLIAPEAGKVRVLNGVGTTIWRLIDGRRTLAEIERTLVSLYDIGQQVAHDDLYAFLDELTERRLVVLDGAGSAD